MVRKTEFVIKFTADLDQIKGWGYDPQDWINLATADFARQSHYNTKFEVQSVEIVPPRKRDPEMPVLPPNSEGPLTVKTSYERVRGG